MEKTETIMEIGKCRIDVNSDGSATIACDGSDPMTLNKADIKLIDGISDIATEIK